MLYDYIKTDLVRSKLLTCVNIFGILGATAVFHLLTDQVQVPKQDLKEKFKASST